MQLKVLYRSATIYKEIIKTIKKKKKHSYGTKKEEMGEGGKS